VSGRIFLASVAFFAFAILAIYALASVVAFFVIVAGTVWLAGVVGGAAAVGAWADERKRAQDAEAETFLWREQAETLADELSHADDTLAVLAAKAAEYDALVAGIGALPVAKPALHIVPPQRSDSWLEQVMDEQAAIGAEQSGDAS